MSFTTDDPNVLREWLTVGPARRLQAARRAGAGADATAWGPAAVVRCDDAGQPQCRSGTRMLAIQQRYGYLWVCAHGTPARPLFALPELNEPGRRMVDCGGIGVATSGLRVVENFLDMGHFPYVHTGTLGKVPHTTVAPYRVEVDPAIAGDIRALDCHFFQPQASAWPLVASTPSTATG